MWKWIKSLFSKKKKPAPPKPKPKPPRPKRPVGANVIVVDGELVDVEIRGLKGFTEDQRHFFVDAMKLKLEVLSSKQFKLEFESMDADETNGMSMSQIYRALLTGKDSYGEQIDHDLDLVWSLYGSKYQRSQTIGYTYPNSQRVWTHRWHYNSWMGDRYGRAYLAGHTMHEYMHNLGFDHEGTHSRSLVYKTGDLVEAIAIRFIDGETPVPVGE